MGKELAGNGWKASEPVDGVRNVTCSSWAGYVDFVNGSLLNYRDYVFRGHALDTWKLESTLDRLIRDSGRPDSTTLRERHLESFTYATRGRRGSAPRPPENDNERWALGQHHGLATPLLDWTESPYVAAYFGFCAPQDKKKGTSNRVIYGLQRASVENKVRALQAPTKKKKASADVVTFVRPMSDDNPRLITQRGLFTRTPDNTTIEDWIKDKFQGDVGGAKLLRIAVPSDEREKAMKSLNRMNINHLSLFPDIYGAAKYCNIELMLDKY